MTIIYTAVFLRYTEDFWTWVSIGGVLCGKLRKNFERGLCRSPNLPRTVYLDSRGIIQIVEKNLDENYFFITEKNSKILKFSKISGGGGIRKSKTNPKISTFWDVQTKKNMFLRFSKISKISELKKCPDFVFVRRNGWSEKLAQAKKIVGDIGRPHTSVHGCGKTKQFSFSPREAHLSGMSSIYLAMSI